MGTIIGNIAPGASPSQEELSGKEDKTNKVARITNGGTADQYPTVAAVKNYRNELLDKSKKNLIAFTDVPTRTSQDVAFSINDNRITVSGKANATTNANLVVDFDPQIELKAETYIASIRDEEGTPSNVMIYFYIQGGDDTKPAFQINGGGAKKIKYEPTETVFIKRVIIGVSKGKTAGTTFHLQLEKGEEATDYEPPYKIKNSLIPDNIADKAEIATLNSAKADKSEVYTKTITDEKFAEVAAEIDKVFESQTEVAAYLNSPQAKAGQTVKVKDAITGDYINYVIQEINGNFTITALEDLLFDTQIIDPVNLLSVSGNEKTLYGVTATIDNQTISLSGTATRAMNLNIRIPTVTLRSGTYTLKRFLYEGAADFSVSLAKGVQTPTTIEYTNIITISKGAADYKTINLENDTDINYISFYILANTKFQETTSLKLHLQKGNAVPYSWGNPNKEKEYTFKEKLIPHHMNYIYVSNEYNLTTEGFGKTRFDSIIAANDSITDNSKDNPYTIIVKSGTTAEPCVYNEFEELYGGTYVGVTSEIPLQGIRTKNYVYYESETPDNPAACVLTWDGADGYGADDFKDALALKKCIFHLTNDINNPAGGMHTHIKGFTMQSKNTRYGIHIESGGYGRNREWLVENCVIKYGGRPATKSKTPIIGIGMSPHEKGTIRKVTVFTYNTPLNNNKIYEPSERALNCHDNYETTKYTGVSAIKAGAELTIENCNFNNHNIGLNKGDVTTNAPVSDTPFNINLINNINISKINIESGNWVKNLESNDSYIPSNNLFVLNANKITMIKEGVTDMTDTLTDPICTLKDGLIKISTDKTFENGDNERKEAIIELKEPFVFEKDVSYNIHVYGSNRNSFIINNNNPKIYFYEIQTDNNPDESKVDINEETTRVQFSEAKTVDKLAIDFNFTEDFARVSGDSGYEIAIYLSIEKVKEEEEEQVTNEKYLQPYEFIAKNTIYTKSEIDTLIASLNSEIVNLNSKIADLESELTNQ